MIFDFLRALVWARDWWYGHSPCVKTDPPEPVLSSGETHARYHLVKTPYFGEILASSHLAKFHSGKRSDVEETISRRGWVLVWWLLLPLLRLYALKIGHIFFFSSVALYAIYGKLLPQNSVKLCLTSVKAVGIVGEGLGCSWGDGCVKLGAIPLVTVEGCSEKFIRDLWLRNITSQCCSKKPFQDDTEVLDTKSMNIKMPWR